MGLLAEESLVLQGRRVDAGLAGRLVKDDSDEKFPAADLSAWMILGWR